MERSASSSDEPDLLTLELLDNLMAWRIRAVERVEFSRALWSEREREIHIKSLQEVVTSPRPDQWPNLSVILEKLGEMENGTTELTLPITELPKIPILNLSITVAGNDVYRIRLDDSARIQARYIMYLSKQMGYSVQEAISEQLADLLAALFYFPSSSFVKVWKNGKFYRRHKPGRRDLTCEATRQYLQEDRNLKHVATSSAFDEWYSICGDIKRIVRSQAISDYLSSTENPIIALPHFIEEEGRRYAGGTDVALWSEEQITLLLRALKNMLVAAERPDEYATEKQVKASRKLLCAYAAYGYRWMAFARCFVPVGKPFTIKVRETRGIYFSPDRNGWIRWQNGLRNTAWKMVAFSDAETNHLSIRVSDPAVRLGDCLALDELTKESAGHADEEESTFELYLRHDSTPERQERIWIKCPLRLARLTSLFLACAMIITACAIALLIWRGVSDIEVSSNGKYVHGLTAKDATVILIPVAFVASFLLVKDTTTLVMRVRRLGQAVLILELFVLLSTAFSLYFWRLVWAMP
ncbi:hypothetical protein ACFY41_06320 [Streptomyces syringium]|uniref:hypothetical protein n=1 Tax=Streptomyces syringium TaxID=76729 RepID=UPI0036C5865F